MLSFTKQGNKMFPEINDFFIFCDYFLSFYRFIFSPYCLLRVTWGYFLQVIAFLSKEKYISWTAKFPLDFRQSFWRKRTETQKEMNDRVAFVFLWLMYCMVYMFTECICLVMLTKWMTKKKKWVLMCHLKVCLSIAVYVLFCPFKITGCIPKLYEHNILFPTPTQPFFRAKNSLPGAWGRTFQFWPRGNKVGGAWALLLPVC